MYERVNEECRDHAKTTVNLEEQYVLKKKIETKNLLLKNFFWDFLTIRINLLVPIYLKQSLLKIYCLCDIMASLTHF